MAVLKPSTMCCYIKVTFCLKFLSPPTRPSDKSVFVFRRVFPPLPNLRYACVALTETNRMRMVDFTEAATGALAEAVRMGYEPGRVEAELPDGKG